MRPFLSERKILCFPFWLACCSGYAFGVQRVQCISNYCHSWLASKSAVLKNMKCKLGSLFYLRFCCCCFCCCCSVKVFAHFLKKTKDLILTKWMYFSFVQTKCSSFPSDVSSIQQAVSCKETTLQLTVSSPEHIKYHLRSPLEKYLPEQLHQHKYSNYSAQALCETCSRKCN